MIKPFIIPESSSTLDVTPGVLSSDELDAPQMETEDDSGLVAIQQKLRQNPGVPPAAVLTVSEYVRYKLGKGVK